MGRIGYEAELWVMVVSRLATSCDTRQDIDSVVVLVAWYVTQLPDAAYDERVSICDGDNRR